MSAWAWALTGLGLGYVLGLVTMAAAQRRRRRLVPLVCRFELQGAEGRRAEHYAGRN